MDIGQLLFVEILKMSEYPGAPFTGDPMTDIVQFFFMPTVIIIAFIMIIIGNVPGINKSKKMEFIFGIAIYLFIITGGYFGFFAKLAGPYFIIMIFILGIIWFIKGHFHSNGNPPTRSSSTGLPSEAVGYEQARRMLPRNVRNLIGIPTINPSQRKKLENELKLLNNRIEALSDHIAKAREKGSNVGNMELRLDELKAARDIILAELEGRVR